MKWITRARPKTDRIACPWLISQFIDPAAEILYVPADQVLDGRSARTPSLRRAGRPLHHRDGKCTFEVLIEDYDLGGDAALVRLARIVHAADISADLTPTRPGPACWPSAWAGSTSRTTTTGCWTRPVRLRRPVCLVPA